MKFRTTLVLFCLSVASPCLAADPFRIVLLPDTQHYSDSATNITHFENQTQWIVDNQATENIVFVSHLGDIVQTASDTTQWSRADAAMDTLDGASNLPYGVVAGNHDGAPTSMANYVTNFGSARYTGKSWYGGADADQHNHYQTFSAGGRQFLHLSLEMQACSTANTDYASVITWAQGVIDAYDSPTIISTHSYLQTDTARTSEGNDVFNELVNDNSQVFMVVGGHVIGEAHRTVQNNSGKDVFEVLPNYQGRTEGGQGWLRILEFDEDAGKINNITYSPSLNTKETDADSQFSFSMDFNNRLGVAPGLIAHYTFDSGTAADSSPDGVNHGGVLQGTASAAGGVLTLDGNSDYVQLEGGGAVQESPALALNEWTLATRFQKTGNGSGNQDGGGGGIQGMILIGKGTGESDSGSVDTNYALGLHKVGSDWVIAGDYESGTGGANHLLTGTTLIADDVWYHVALTYDGNEMKVYLDGILENTLAATDLPASVTAQLAALGAGLQSNGDARGLFEGLMDDVLIYDSALELGAIEVLAGVPEPATMSLLALGGLGILSRRRRRS